MPKLSYPQGRKAAATVSKSEPVTADVTGQVLEPVEGHQVEASERVAPDDASVAFQKQLDAIRKSEQAQRERNAQLMQEREEAIRRANEREAEIHRLQKTTAESQVEAVSAALVAATAEAETAQRDLEKAFELGDYKGQAEAQRRLSRAEANIVRLEVDKTQVESLAKTAAEQKVTTQPEDGLDKFNLPPLAKSWLRQHREYLENPRKNAMIQNLHYEVIDEGHEPYSQEYFESLETHLGMRKPPPEPPGTSMDDDEYSPEPRKRAAMVSAPVSREVPSSGGGDRPGTVRLSVAQKEAAKIAGISEKDYAEQLLKLRAEKLNGNYGGAP